MSIIYFFVTQSSMYKDTLQVCKTYFEGGGFFTAFITALIVAAAFCVLYYAIGRFSFFWSKISTWIITMCLAGVVSFAVTGIETGIHDVKGGAIHKVLNNNFKKRSKGLLDNEKKSLNAEKAKLQKEFKKNYFLSKPVNALCWSNLLYTMLLFYVFSIIINGVAGYARNIPHRGLIGLIETIK